MLRTWQYRRMDKGMKLWCGETAGRRHAVEHVSSRQPAASSQLLRDDRTGPPRHAGGFGGAALQADGRPPSSSRSQPLVPAGRVRRGERGARRERCGSLQRCGARSGAERAAVRSRRLASRGHAERYAERPDAKEVHPENDQKAARSPWSHARTCEVGRHHRAHQRSTEQRGGERSSGSSGGAAEPLVTHLLATRQGGPKHAVCSKRPAHADSFRHAVFAARRPALSPTGRQRVPAAHAEQARGV